jgi:hypothetical protein
VRVEFRRINLVRRNRTLVFLRPTICRKFSRYQLTSLDANKFATTKRQAMRNKFVKCVRDSPTAAQERNDEANAETNAGIAAVQRTEINAGM